MVSTPASSSSATAARYTPHRSFSTGTERSIVKTGEENTMANGQPDHGGAHYTQTTIRLASTACSPSRSLAPQEAEPGAGEDWERQREVDRAPGRGMVRISQAMVTT